MTQHRILAPLYELLAEERRTESEDITAANLVAWRLLHGPFLGGNHEAWHLVEVAQGEWRLMQDYRNGHEWIEQDPLNAYYADPYGDYDEDDEDAPVRDFFELDARRRDPWKWGQPRRLMADESDLPSEVVARADALLERLSARAPQFTARLLSPTEEQQAERQDIRIECLDALDLQDKLRELLGDYHDSSMRSYGMEYYSAPSWARDKDRAEFHFLAHNGEELCGMLKLAEYNPWSYSLSYVAVAPGFRGQGLSQKLYEKAIERCIADRRVLSRTEPGNDTPLAATLAYDRLIARFPVIQTARESTAWALEQLHQAGVPYERLFDIKDALDAHVPTPEQRAEGNARSYRAHEDWKAEHMATIDALIAEYQPKPKRGMKP